MKCMLKCPAKDVCLHHEVASSTAGHIRIATKNANAIYLTCCNMRQCAKHSFLGLLQESLKQCVP